MMAEVALREGQHYPEGRIPGAARENQSDTKMPEPVCFIEEVSCAASGDISEPQLGAGNTCIKDTKEKNYGTF
jgi:hypothetical protein